MTRRDLRKIGVIAFTAYFCALPYMMPFLNKHLESLMQELLEKEEEPTEPGQKPLSSLTIPAVPRNVILWEKITIETIQQLKEGDLGVDYTYFDREYYLTDDYIDVALNKMYLDIVRDCDELKGISRGRIFLWFEITADKIISNLLDEQSPCSAKARDQITFDLLKKGVLWAKKPKAMAAAEPTFQEAKEIPEEW